MAGSEVKADLWVTEYMTPWDIYAHGITNVLAYKKTAYQEMYIAETGAYGKGLILDGKWQSSTVDEFLYHEALVHPAMIARRTPRKVLVLGGGEGATVREVLRWKTVERVMMVDIDGEVVDACREHLPEMHAGAFDDPRVELVIGDALQVLDTTSEQWDVVISDLTDPIEEGPSFQLFTKEFFEKLQRVLVLGGTLVLQAGPIAPPLLKTHARVINTLNRVFSNVISYASYVPIFGEPWGFALCCAEPLNTQPNPDSIDRLLGEQTHGGLRLIDGITLLGLLQTPAYVRHAIASETQVYTLQNPPKFFGKGVAKQ